MYHQRLCVSNLHRILFGKNIPELLRRNRSRRKQVGEIIETHTAFFGRYYTSDTYDNGRRKAKTVKLADKSDIYRSKNDVLHLLNRLMEAVNTGKEFPSAQLSLNDFIEKHYLPWCKDAQKSAATVNGYRQIWECYWQKHVGKIPLTDLRTSDATAVLDHHAKAGLGRNTLSHIKFMLSGVYEWAIATGVLPLSANPIRSAVKGQGAKWTVKVPKPQKTTKYSLETIIAMLQVLEPVDLRAAVAVALAYFAALRPAEIRGLVGKITTERDSILSAVFGAMLLVTQKRKVPPQVYL